MRAAWTARIIKRQEERRRQHQERPCLSGMGVYRGGKLHPALWRRGQTFLQAEEGQNEQHRGNQSAGAQAGACELLHAEGGTAFRCEALFRLNGLVTTVSQQRGLGMNQRS